MALIGYITRRDEDGTWYLSQVIGQNASWSQSKGEAMDCTGRFADDFMAETAHRDWYQVTFHAIHDPNHDDAGNWTGNVPNENGWTA